MERGSKASPFLVYTNNNVKITLLNFLADYINFYANKFLGEIVIPRVIDYLDYREFLQDFYLAKKYANPNYSYRVFTAKGDLKSPSHLKMISEGSRNLTSKTLFKYIKALGLTSDRDKRYFELLVKYNQEKNIDFKEEFFQKLMEEKRKKGLTLLEHAQYNFLANWENVAIYVLIGVKKIEEDPELFVKLLKGKITKKQARESIETLVLLGFIERTHDGILLQRNGALTTSDEIKSMAIHKYHQSMISLGLDALKNVEREKRELNGVTVPINLERLPEVKEKIRSFRKEINEMCSAFDDQECVYQLNIQFFPISEVMQ